MRGTTKVSARLRRGIGGCAAGAGLAVSLLGGAAPAQAAIAGAPSLATPLPDLSNVAVLRQTPLGSGTGSMAQWCFDAQLGTKTASGVSTLPAGPPGTSNGAVVQRFHLAGYNSAQQASPIAAYIDPSNPNCVDGVFEAGFQARAFTVGTADAGAVSSSTGLLSIPDAHEVLPSDARGLPGRTTGPNILQVAVDATDNQILYVFDHDIAPGSAATGAGLFFYDASGNKQLGNFATPGYKNNVVVATFNPNTAPVSAAALIGAESFSLRAVDGTPVATAGETNRLDTLLGPAATLPGSVTAGGPALIAAAPVLNNGAYTNQVDFTFDKAVSLPASGSLGSFVVWKESGGAATASGGSVAYATTNNQTVLRLTFPFFNGVGSEFVPQFVRASVTTDGAVTSVGLNKPGLEGSVAMSGSADAPGYTSGPDIQQAIKDTTNSRVILLTDQPIFDDSPNPSDFALIASSGATIANPTSVTVTGSPTNQLILQFASSNVVAPGVGVAYVPTSTPILVGWPTDPAVEQMTAFTSGAAGLRLGDGRGLQLAPLLGRVKHKHVHARHPARARRHAHGHH